MESTASPDAAWKDALNITNVMLKLREQQPEKERDKLIDCKAGKSGIFGKRTNR